MSYSIACGDNISTQNLIKSESIISTQPFQPTECPVTVHETVCVRADVTIAPKVTVGDIKLYCIGTPVIGMCPGMPTAKCTFTVSQNLCIQVPVTFSAKAIAIPKGIICGIPAVGACPITTFCTHTIGFFRNNSYITNALITAAGGSIILGINRIGLSFTVTTSNAVDILSLNTPSPPAPSLPPFRGQYQNLYAQLLAANLNVLYGATCDFAVTAINAANSFLANSPPGGMMGAPTVQSPLVEFNEGAAAGCPSSCPSE